jgi:hypothetical protein
MPDISTANQQKINGVMCPICQEFNFGSRISYFTTAGALSSAVITGPTIASGTLDGMSFSGCTMTNPYARYAPAAATGTTDGAGLAAIDTGGVFLIDPSNASGFCVHLTSAATTGMLVKLINIATGATGVVNLGATKDIIGAAFVASSSGYFNFTVRANSAVELMAISATRWIFLGSTAGIPGLGVTT